MSKYKDKIKLNENLTLQDCIEYFKNKGIEDLNKIKFQLMFDDWPSPEPFL